MTDTNLVKADEVQTTLASSNIEVLPHGLKFKAELSRDEWNNAFLSLQAARDTYQWYLGDLVKQADYQWKGELYDVMMESTGYDYQTLRIFSSVSSTYNPEVREYIYNEMFARANNAKLSYSHFVRLASLMNSHEPQAIDFLIRAGTEGWSVRRLEEQVDLWRNQGRTAQPVEVREEPEYADGWTSVKEAGVRTVVPAPETVYDDHLDDNYYMNSKDYKRAAVQLFKYEIEDLIAVLEGDDRFTSLIDRLEKALGGI